MYVLPVGICMTPSRNGAEMGLAERYFLNTSDLRLSRLASSANLGTVTNFTTENNDTPIIYV